MMFWTGFVSSCGLVVVGILNDGAGTTGDSGFSRICTFVVSGLTGGLCYGKALEKSFVGTKVINCF